MEYDTKKINQQNHWNETNTFYNNNNRYPFKENPHQESKNKYNIIPKHSERIQDKNKKWFRIYVNFGKQYYSQIRK